MKQKRKNCNTSSKHWVYRSQDNYQPTAKSGIRVRKTTINKIFLVFQSFTTCVNSRKTVEFFEFYRVFIEFIVQYFIYFSIFLNFLNFYVVWTLFIGSL